MKHKNTECWQNAKFFFFGGGGVEVGGTYIYSRDLNGQYPWNVILVNVFELL